MSPRAKNSSPRNCRTEKQLDLLTPQQQEQVFAHCEPIRLRDGVAWLKTEFEITLAETRLRIWLRKERVRKNIEARLDKICEARDGAKLIAGAVRSASEITDANLVLLAQAAFEEFLKDPEKRDAKLLAEYMAFALRARDLELRGSANQLAREKHYFDLAKKSLEFVDQLRAINDSPDDERTKVDKAMVLLFGERPDVTDFGMQSAEHEVSEHSAIRNPHSALPPGGTP
jgi:hypothetical protein